MPDFSTGTFDFGASMLELEEQKVIDSFMRKHREDWKGGRSIYVPLYGKISKGIYSYMSQAWYEYGFKEFISNNGRDDELRANAIKSIATIVIAVMEEAEDMKKLMVECSHAGVPFVIFSWVEGVFRVYMGSPTLEIA